jgi:hypothetical protein
MDLQPISSPRVFLIPQTTTLATPEVMLGSPPTRKQHHLPTISSPRLEGPGVDLGAVTRVTEVAKRGKPLAVSSHDRSVHLASDWWRET